MNTTTRHILSVLVAGLMAGASALAGAVSNLPPDAGVGDLGAGTLLTAFIAFILSAGKDAQSRLAEPPKASQQSDEKEHF